MAEVVCLQETYKALAATISALCGPSTLVQHENVRNIKCPWNIAYGRL
jgi:hypothetical protein